MNRFRAWGLTAALTVGAGAPAASAADPPADAKPAGRGTLFGKMFGSKPPGPVARSGAVTAAKPAALAGPLSPEVLADALRQEQEAYLRRLSVCGELRRIGADRNDEALVRQADELERQAAALYNQRVAALGVPKVRAPLPEPTPSVAGLGAADPKLAAKRLIAPAAPVPVDPAVRTAEARSPGDVIREVKP